MRKKTTNLLIKHMRPHNQCAINKENGKSNGFQGISFGFKCIPLPLTYHFKAIISMLWDGSR